MAAVDLRTLRRSRGMTQGGLAAAAGVTTTTVCFAEGGRLLLSDAQIDKLAAALGVEAEAVVELRPGRIVRGDAQVGRDDG